MATRAELVALLRECMSYIPDRDPFKRRIDGCSIIRDLWNPFSLYCSEDDWDWSRRDSVEAERLVDRQYGSRVIRRDWLTWRDGTVPKLAMAAVTRECQACLGPGRVFDSGNEFTPHPICPRCDGKGDTPITGPIDPLRLAVLADALEEAGCTDDGILGHLRTTSEKCPVCTNAQDWGPCWECNGTGTRPVSHVWTPSGGCWVLQALLR